MTTYKIYRKESGWELPKLTKGEKDVLRNRVDALSRISRPEIVDLFLDGGFAKLTPIPSAIVNNPPLRELDYADCGWIIPQTCLGKSASVQTLKLWIAKHLATAIDPDSIAIVACD